MLGAGDWSARVRVARRLLPQAWLPTPADWLAFRTPSLPLQPGRLTVPEATANTQVTDMTTSGAAGDRTQDRRIMSPLL